MIVCPNCDRQNPDGAEACEACYTPLPATTICPSCGATVQADASFCGQCGDNLQSRLPPETAAPLAAAVPPTVVPPSAPDPIPDPSARDPDPTPAPLKSGEPSSAKTQLQVSRASLLHVQTDTPLELPFNLAVIHIGKPNSRVPPDIDVSGFPHSEVVSRVHADIRVEAGAYYIEDAGSSNGTYINNLPLQSGDRHRLRPGDRIALGKSDLVTFLFQVP